MNKQQDFWTGKLGQSWAERLRTFSGAYSNWENDSGWKLKDLLEVYFKNVHKDTNILEVGCGTGWVLNTLEDLGFKNLFGIDVNEKAIEIAKENNPKMRFTCAPIEKLNIRHFYNLILTSAFLIHIHPDNLDDTMTRIYNSTTKYIFGRELSTKKPEENPGDSKRFEGQYWTRNFKDKWLEMFPDLKVAAGDYLPMKDKKDWVYTEVYLLEK